MKKASKNHPWEYALGEWKEKKVAQDLFEFNFNVQKKQKGKKSSKEPIGTEYHWYILAHQNVRKIDENTYSTAMRGYKYKLASKKANSRSWSSNYAGQRKKLITYFQGILDHLIQEELEDAKNPPPKKSKRKFQSTKEEE